MSTSNSSHGRIVLESLSEKNEIPVLRFNSRNFWFILLLAASGFFMIRNIGIGGLPVAVGAGTLGLVVGIDLVRGTPDYCNVTQWLRAIFRYHREPDKYVNAADAHVKTDSTLKAAIQTSKSTREQTKIKRLYPPHGLIERTDGNLISVLKFEPPNMDFATADEYVQYMDMVAGWFNDSIDFEVTLHATTEPVRMGDYLDQLSDRLEDPDVQGRDVLKAVMHELEEGRRKSIQANENETIHFYLITSVEKTEVSDSIGGDDDASDRSILFSLLSSDKEDQDIDSEVVRRQRMEKLMQQRISKIKQIAYGGGDLGTDTEVRQVSTLKAAQIFSRYWTGHDYTDPSQSREDVPENGFTRGAVNEEEVVVPDDINEVMA